MKRIRLLVLTLMSILVMSSFASASEDITILINNSEISTDVAPVIMNGRTMVPARAIFESLGADVGWNGETRTVTVSAKGVDVNLVVGSRVAVVNGNNIYLDQPAAVVEGRTIVPIRFISENIGARVGWNPDTKTVSLETEGSFGDDSLLGIANPSSPSGGISLGEGMAMRATAYGDSAEENGGWAGLTAIGTRLRPGVVAVDPKVIPLRTKLYIEYADGTPYGYAVAEDVGGSIKGNKIDIFMDSSLVRNFGVKNMKVYIVK